MPTTPYLTFTMQAVTLLFSVTLFTGIAYDDFNVRVLCVWGVRVCSVCSVYVVGFIRIINNLLVIVELGHVYL